MKDIKLQQELLNKVVASAYFEIAVRPKTREITNAFMNFAPSY
jgi:hypothetical protein